MSWTNGLINGPINDQKKNKKNKKLFFPLNFVLSNFERTKFERTINLGLHSKEQIFSFETNFERTLFDQTTYPGTEIVDSVEEK